MSWNRTGGTLMQSSGEFRLSEPRSTALIEAATRGDRSGVFILIGQGSWVEQCDAMSENGAFGCRTGQCTPARWLELPRLTRRDRGLRPFCPLACIGLVSHSGGTRPGTRRCSDWPVTATSQASSVSCKWVRTLKPETWCASTDYNGSADPMYHAHTLRHHLRHVHVYTHPASKQHGNTAMMLAAEKNRYLVIEALLAAHADPRAKNYARACHANRYRPHTARPPNACTLRPWQCGMSPNQPHPCPQT